VKILQVFFFGGGATFLTHSVHFVILHNILDTNGMTMLSRSRSISRTSRFWTNVNTMSVCHYSTNNLV